VVLVSQQHEALVRNVLRVAAAEERIDLLGLRRIVDGAVGEHAAQDAMNGVIEARYGNLAILDSFFERLAEIG